MTTDPNDKRSEGAKRRLQLAGPLRVAMSTRRTAVALQFPMAIDGKGELLYLQYEAAELDEFIKALYHARAMLRVPHAALDESKPITGIDGPAFRIGRDVMSDKVTLSFEHPGLGWLTFSFQPDQARTMAAVLADVAKEAPRPAQTRPH